MSKPYRIPGEYTPDRPEPPAIRLPKGKLEGRGKDLRAKRLRWRAWLNRAETVPLLMVIAGIVLVIVVMIAYQARVCLLL